MFLDFTKLYLEFFITVLGIVILMIVGYVLFSRPKTMKVKQKKVKKVKQPKVKRSKPIKEEKLKKSVSKKNISNAPNREDDSYGKESDTDDLYDSNDDEQAPNKLVHQDKEQFKPAPVTEDNRLKEDTLEIVSTPKPIEQVVTKEPIVLSAKIEKSLGNEDDDEIIDDFEQVDELIENQRDVEKPKPVKVTPKAPKPKPKPKTVDLGRYHVLYKKEDNTWYVKREGSDKVVRSLETQREAFAFATIKAINQKTTVVVHKRDGKIKKGAL